LPMADHGSIYHCAGDIAKMKIVIRMEKSTAFGLGQTRKETTEMSEMEMEDRSETIVNWGERIGCPWKTGEGTSNSSRVFTYTTGETLPTFISNRELLLSSIDHENRRKSAETNLAIHRNKKVSPFEVWSRSNPIIDRPIPIDRRTLISCNRSTMYIMAYLGPTDRR
ncbi:hypothetical protein PFISCL1PPCAC_14967, partial [Pristionchus fissidentatus]